jgi:hypothetical protein
MSETARVGTRHSARKKPSTSSDKALKSKGSPTYKLVAMVEKQPNKRGPTWVRAEPETSEGVHQDWTVEATPTLICILTDTDDKTVVEYDEDDYPTGPPRAADNPLRMASGLSRHHSLPDNISPSAQQYYKTNRREIHHVAWFKLEDLQSYHWHDTVLQSGWVTKEEALFVKESGYGYPPTEWTKTVKDREGKVNISWPVPIASLCREFIETFIPRVRDLNIEPEYIRVVFFLQQVPSLKKMIVDLSKEP